MRLRLSLHSTSHNPPDRSPPPLYCCTVQQEGLLWLASQEQFRTLRQNSALCYTVHYCTVLYSTMLYSTVLDGSVRGAHRQLLLIPDTKRTASACFGADDEVGAVVPRVEQRHHGVASLARRQPLPCATCPRPRAYSRSGSSPYGPVRLHHIPAPTTKPTP